MFRILGGLCIVLASSYLGIYYSTILNLRFAIYDDYCRALAYLENLIKYTDYDLQDIFIKLSNYSKTKYFKNILVDFMKELNESDTGLECEGSKDMSLIWKKCVRENLTFFKINDYTYLDEFIELFKFINRETQISSLKSLGIQAENYCNALREEGQRKKKAYIALGTSIGAIIVIALI